MRLYHLLAGAVWLSCQYLNCCLLKGPDLTLLVLVQVVVDAIDLSLLASSSTSKTFDFGSISEEELHDIEIPLSLQAGP